MGVCLVTGGGGPGIGSACCRALAKQHHTVWAGDIDQGAAQAIADELGEGGRAIHMDIGDPDSISSAISHIQGDSGHIDVLVNSAGVTITDQAANISHEQFELMLAVNLRGPWLCSREVIPSMIENGGGNIVNICSFQSIASEQGFSVYAASKAGVAALTRGIAREYGMHGIRCNAVSPGWVPPEREAPWVQRVLRTRQMLPRVIEPVDIAEAVAFLAGEGARAITGVNLLVDAGSSAMLGDTPLPKE